MNNRKTRSTLVGVTGGYLVYMAWQLFQGRGAPDTTMPVAVSILFAVLFALAGCGLMYYALRLWQQAQKEDDDNGDRKDDPLK